MDYQRASDLFNELLDVPETDLDAALNAACGGNAALRSEVVRLLQADRDAGGFLERGAMKDGALMLRASGGATVPQTIAHYRILSKLGEGGMGEVWRARDSKLERDVAIKCLPEAFAADPDRLARFSREAQVLASLTHPNIAAIFGMEDRALIMELVEGPTLAERIAAGPLPWEEAAEIACQIASALEAAHESGVVHRDLKPANVKVMPNGQVKVLDFGLAKPQGSAVISGDPASPTTAPNGSMAGTILGTAAYMAPEQAKGKIVDRRADIWAYGVVLYEMLTGRNPFARETVAETLAAVLNEDPDLERVPASARPVIERCLRKDPRRRWQSVADARIGIEDALAETPEEPKRGSRWLPWLVWVAVSLALIAAILIPVSLFLGDKPLPPPVQFTVNSPGNGSYPLEHQLRVSPDGASILFLARNPGNGLNRAYLYTLGTGATRELPGTDGITDAFWSPDNRSLLLSRNGSFSRMDLDGNSFQPIANSPQPLPFESGYSSWGPDGAATGTRDGIVWFHPETADSHVLLRNEAAPRANSNSLSSILLFPSLLPSDKSGAARWILYNSYGETPSNGVSVRVASLDGAQQRELFHAERSAIYAAPGYVLYLRGAMLMARAIDPGSGQVRGDAVPVIGPVERPDGSAAAGSFSASSLRGGVLAFIRNAASDFRMEWFDRSGKRVGTVGAVADYTNPALAPDGERLAVSIRDPATGRRDIWVLDLLREAASRITFDAADHTNPAWSPDGGRIAYSSDRRGARDIYIKNASGIGAEALVIESKIPKNVEDWSSDGRWLAYNEAIPNNSDDLVALPLDSRKPVDILRTRFQEDKGRFSLDGKWLAYQSDESGRSEVYIQPFPPTGEKWQISNDHGGQPQWRGDGKELYYSTFTTPARMMAVDITATDRTLRAGIPHMLFEAAMQDAGARNRWVATRDGRKFLAVVPVNENPVHSFRVIVDWPSLLQKNRIR